MAYVTNKELNAMNETLTAVKNLTDDQRARVFGWVNAAIADAQEEEAEAQRKIAEYLAAENAAPSLVVAG